MRKRANPTVRRRAKGKATGYVVRISQEEWAAKCASRSKQGEAEIAESYDRALQLTRAAKAG